MLLLGVSSTLIAFCPLRQTAPDKNLLHLRGLTNNGSALLYAGHHSKERKTRILDFSPIASAQFFRQQDWSCIEILNHLFFWPEQFRQPGELSIVFLVDENPNVASAGSGGVVVGGARGVKQRGQILDYEVESSPSSRNCGCHVTNEAPRSKAPRVSSCEILRSPLNPPSPRLRRVLLTFILAASCEVFGEGE